MFILDIDRFNRDFGVPQAHVSCRVVPVGVLISRGDMDNRMSIFATRLKQFLHRRNDAVIDPLAGERVAGPSPGIGQIDRNQCRFFAKPYAPLKAALFVDAGTFIKCALQNGVQIFGTVHFLVPLLEI